MSASGTQRMLSGSRDIPVDAPPATAPVADNTVLPGYSAPLPAGLRRPVSTPPAAISMAELRAGMQQHLRTSGALKTLKTQLRGMVLTELLHQRKHARRTAEVHGVGEGLPLEEFEARRRGAAPPKPTRAPNDGINDSGVHHSGPSGDPSGDHAHEPPSPSNFANWSACVADAVIENHLRRTRRPMSLSIFSTEAEVPPLSDTGAPSDEERCLQQLLLLEPAAGGDGGLADDIDDDPNASGPVSRKKSLLQQLVEQQLLSRDTIQKHHQRHRHHCGTQTTEADKRQSENEKNPLLSVECRLAAVDAKYALAFSQLGHRNDKSFFTRAEVDRRLQQYKADVHEQLRAEYEHKYKTYETDKLCEVKDALEERYQLMMQNKKEELAEMQRSLTVKYEQDRQRLQQAKADVERRAMDLDRREREMRSTLNDHEVELTAHEATLSALKEKLRVAQLQCAKWEELSGSRLMEADNARSRERRRLEDMQRMQAEHAAEMRLKEEELSRLRFRVRMLLNHGQPTGDTVAETPGSGAAPAPARAPQDRMGDDLYRMLVRTEELQRTALDQQRQVQRQHEADLAARLAAQQQQQRWDAAWQETQPRPTPVTAATRPPHIPPVGPPASHSPAPVLSAVETPAPSQAVAAVPAAAPAPAPAPAPSASASPSQPSAAASQRTSSDTARPAAEKAADPSTSARSSVTSTAHSSPSRSPIAAAVEDTPGSKPTSSSSRSKSTSGSRSHRAAVHSPAGKDTGKDATEAARQKQQQMEAEVARLAGEEQARRATVREDEENNRKGIEWAAKSQLSVLEAQERDRRARGNDSDGGSSDSSRGRGRGQNTFLDRMEQQRREARALEEAQANVIYRDDSDDDDSILFGDKGSTGSSF